MPEALAKLPVLDSFTAPEDPLSREGAWAPMWEVVGTGYIPPAGGWRSRDLYPKRTGAYWTPSFFVDEPSGVAVSSRVNAGPGIDGRYFSLWLDMEEPTTNRAGYELLFTWTGNNDYKVVLNVWSDIGPIPLGTVEDVVLPLGSDFALVDQGSTVSAWVDAGAGYVRLISAGSTEWRGGYAGLLVSGVNTRLRRFAAGELPRT
ncbi:MAG: hypothetical protein ACRDPE_20110 [Solirubrobacterales bacterium]